ncbi:MAG: thioredoxin [Bacteroidia bacterium]|nr:thioredoxin [Bacteroidia bacterium]
MGNFNEIINGNTPVLVDFYADWCAPCKMMAPIMQQVSREMEGKVKVIKVDVDKNEDVARKYQIRSIPTMILFKNGKVMWQGVGVMQADQIKAIIQKNS